MEQAYHRVSLNNETMAIVCPCTEEPCHNEACYEGLVCLESGEKVIPERREAA